MLTPLFPVFGPRLFRLPLGVAAAALLLAGCQGNSSTQTGTEAPPFVAESGRPVGPPGQDVPVARRSDPAAAASNELLPDSLHLVSPGQAGQLRLGMPETELRALVPAGRLRPLESPAGQQVLELLDAGQPTAPATRLVLEPGPAGTAVLARMLITDPQYRTGEGIGVGSPFGAARQNLGFTKLRDTPFGLAAVSGVVRLGWLLDASSLPAGANENVAPAAVPAAARITGIFIY